MSEVDGKRMGLSFQPYNEEAAAAQIIERDYLATKYGNTAKNELASTVIAAASTPVPPQEQQVSSRSPRNTEQIAQRPSSSGGGGGRTYTNPDDRPLPQPQLIFKDTAIDYQLPASSPYGLNKSITRSRSPSPVPSPEGVDVEAFYQQMYNKDEYYFNNYNQYQYLNPSGNAFEASDYRNALSGPEEGDNNNKFFAPKIALSPPNAIKARARQMQMQQKEAQQQQKQAQALPKAAAGSKQYSSGPLSTKAAGALRPPRRAGAASSRPPPRGRQARQASGDVSLDELRRYQADNESEALEEMNKAVAGWKIRFFIELARRKVREIKIRQDSQAQFMILGREVDKLSHALEVEKSANRDKFFQQDVVELKVSMEYWKNKAAEQAELLEAALRQRGAIEGQHAAEQQRTEQLRSELSVSQKACQELIVKSNSLEASRALHEKEGDVIKRICAEYDRKLEQAHMVAVGLKQTIVEIEMREREARREALLLNENELELRSGLLAGLNESVAQLSQEKNKLHIDLRQAVEAGEQLRQQLEQARAANAKLQNDHGVFEQLITDFSVKARDSEKNRLAQHIRISELSIRNENQAAKVDSLQGSVKSLGEEVARMKDRCAVAALELDRSMMVKEDCEEWVRVRTQTILNTSGYCRFIEEQLFIARREVLRQEEIARNVLENVPPGAELSSQHRLLPVGFEDMFEATEPADKVHTPVPHRRVEELEGRLVHMFEGLEGRLSRAMTEATPAKDALLQALERQVQQAVKDSLYAHSTAVQARVAPEVERQQQLASPAFLSTMVAGLEARIDSLVADAAGKLSTLTTAAQQQLASPQSRAGGHLSPEPSVAYISPADAAEDALRRGEKRSALKTMTQIRHSIEEEQERAEELSEELDFLVSRKAEVRVSLLRWQEDFSALCGRSPDATDKAKSHRYVELIGGYRGVNWEVQQKHTALRAIADSVEALKVQLQASTQVVEGITGVKQPLHTYGVRVKEQHRLSAAAVDPLLLGTDEEGVAAEGVGGIRITREGPSTPSRARQQVAAPRRQQQTPPPRASPAPPPAAARAAKGRGAETKVRTPKREEQAPAAAPAPAPSSLVAAPAPSSSVAAPAPAPSSSVAAPAPSSSAAPAPSSATTPGALLASIAQTQEALQIVSARKASAALSLKQWGITFKSSKGRDPAKGDLAPSLVEPYNDAKSEEARLRQELAALNAAYEQAAKEALFA